MRHLRFFIFSALLCVQSLALSREKEISFLDVTMVALAPIESDGMSIWTYLPSGEDEHRWSSQLTVYSMDGLDFPSFRKDMEKTFVKLADLLPAVQYDAKSTESMLADYVMRSSSGEAAEHVAMHCFQSQSGKVVIVDLRRRAYSDHESFLADIKSSRDAFIARFAKCASTIKE